MILKEAKDLVMLKRPAASTNSLGALPWHGSENLHPSGSLVPLVVESSVVVEDEKDSVILKRPASLAPLL